MFFVAFSPCFDPTDFTQLEVASLGDPNDLTISAVVQESRTTSDTLLTLTSVSENSDPQVGGW